MPILSHIELLPDKKAVIKAMSEESLTYGALGEAMNRLAAVFRQSCQVGDRIAALMANELAYFTVIWGARRAGLRCVPVNWHLTVREISYIVANSDARILVASESLVDRMLEVRESVPDLAQCLTSGPSRRDCASIWDAMNSVAAAAPRELADGNLMYYSSGTTGWPKAILRPLPHEAFGVDQMFSNHMRDTYHFTPDSIYYSPAPLYHAAGSGWSQCVHEIGGTVIITEKFDAELTLALIERYRVTHAQFVPTHFVRLLKLPLDVRSRYDLSSLRYVVHAAAPCPPEIKRAMIDWLGPIIFEYYSATEGAGYTAVDSVTWLKKPGTVGKPVWGRAHILDDEGNELPPGAIGTVYFENVLPFVYHNDPDKTASFFNDRGWGCNGDVGWLDDDGYLFLADRKHHMIISGGVNIYPQECENILVTHPAVLDAAVIGVPNIEYGEEVKAIVELAPHAQPGTPRLARELIDHCLARLAHYKCPKSVEFIDQLPRLPSGKVRKRDLKATYWGSDANLIVR
jgi:acyl-CoA synthetase (AMP-forming)/AMP-acid ligase II